MHNEEFTTTSFEPDNGLILDIEFDTNLKIGFEDESDCEDAGEVALTERITGYLFK